uniref:Uncharacterized protein n=1 Tax=Picea glauca TaxID=3330 RepID=A0A101M1N3_PICGL|nr:hypothetical protein ABT39_MTgene3794 [Picea glauca]QHR91122.1 hypothetical protein Q903MT_gene5154 [Picea sitchensis]
MISSSMSMLIGVGNGNGVGDERWKWRWQGQRRKQPSAHLFSIPHAWKEGVILCALTVSDHTCPGIRCSCVNSCST